ncbi:lung adenoma susceptibility protein 2 [Rhinichthys klamathensis goyatoka]|uniref:lung adenoma susceptibility protein 2 n=1 Tax=Rhinichthys klamathensis goyatoka TaxID=3034132 RepID=UPI0024B49221|nr:lung adenoma susceptibility protein 2 [Rhinichthys klamathensis goyatoka]
MMASPESSVSSLLATSGRLRSSIHPEPVSTIRYKDKPYASASQALDAYIWDFHRSLRDSGTATGALELPKPPAKPHPRNRDVLKTSLTDGELDFLNIPVRKRDSDRLSVTTDDLLALPNDGSLPVTRTSALLSRSGSSFPSGLSFNSSSRSQKRSSRRPAPPANRDWESFPVDDLLMGLRSHRQAPPPNVLLANRTHPPDTARSTCLPRWMTSQKSEMDFSGMTSVPDRKSPLWLRQCEEPQSDPPRTVPSWVGELEESSRHTQPSTGAHPYDDQIVSLMLNTSSLVYDQNDQSVSLMLNAPPLGLCELLKEHNTSGETETLDADRSWDNPPVAFKPPVPVGGADDPQTPEELQRSKSAGSCSSGYSSRKHPGPVEALKHMLFRLQAVQHDISQSHASTGARTLERETLGPAPQEETEETAMGSDESLQRALLHLDRLKTLVDDMNERKARAEDHGTHCKHTPAATITNGARIKKRL